MLLTFFFRETRGTKIVIDLKDEALSFAYPDFVKSIIKKYSNFVGFPIYVNGESQLWFKKKKGGKKGERGAGGG